MWGFDSVGMWALIYQAFLEAMEYIKMENLFLAPSETGESCSTFNEINLYLYWGDSQGIIYSAQSNDFMAHYSHKEVFF